MSYRRTPFAPGEHYHCYTRGIDKRKVFETKQDYERFQQALYLCNDSERFDRNNFFHHSHEKIFTLPRGTPLVAISSYTLIPNHFHIEFKELVPGGSSKFLQKLGTSYTMYFNAKEGRIGSLFVTPCRSKHIANDRYLKHVIQYIHLNTAELYEHGWKQGVIHNIKTLKKKMAVYPYSSLCDYIGPTRPERAILDRATMDMLRDELPPLERVVAEAEEYYKELKY